MIFEDRRQAGERLAQELTSRGQDLAEPLVLALPRGGVTVAEPIAEALKAPLDVLVVRKLGVPGHSELAMGALAPGGVRVMNEEIIASLRVPPDAIETVAEREGQELDRRQRLYRGDAGPLDVAGRDVVLVDDGLATGATARVAVESLRQMGAATVILAVPVAAPDVAQALRRQADEVVVLETPQPFEAVGRWYRDFSEVTDEQVIEVLAAHRHSRRPG